MALFSFTFGQQGLSLTVKHDVDPRERNISEESGHQTGEQSCRAFSLNHTAQGPTYAYITVPATLQHKKTSNV